MPLCPRQLVRLFMITGTFRPHLRSKKTLPSSGSSGMRFISSHHRLASPADFLKMLRKLLLPFKALHYNKNLLRIFYHKNCILSSKLRNLLHFDIFCTILCQERKKLWRTITKYPLNFGNNLDLNKYVFGKLLCRNTASRGL